MSRYRFLRRMGSDFITAAFVSSLNAAMGVPSDEIRFLTVIIEMEQDAALTTTPESN